jgi:hypothetical protein
MKGVPGAEKVLEKSIDYMRYRWLSYSVEKQEARLHRGVASTKKFCTCETGDEKIGLP